MAINMRDMKNSGVEWINTMPSNWDIIKVKYIASNEKNSFIDGDWIESDIITEVGVRYLTTGNIGEGYFKEQGNGFISEETMDKMNCLIVYPGDLIISRLNKPVARACRLPNNYEKYVIAVDNVVLRPKANLFNLDYLTYAMNIDGYNEEANIVSRGATMSRISRTMLGNQKLPNPPICEQNRIVEQLSPKVVMIDRIIEKTKQSIEEYKRYKQSLITEVVTKGLDKNVKMKDSGVEWIGEIPEHWSNIKIKYIFDINKRIVGELGHKVLSVTQKGLKIKDIESNEGQISADYSKYQYVDINDYVMNHMDLLTGWVDLSIFKGVTSPDYRVFTMKTNLTHSKDYYKIIFQMYYSNRIFYGMGQGVSDLGRWRLQTDKFKNAIIPLPPHNEQIEIAEFVNNKVEEINRFIDKKVRFISELESYKKSLIYEVVTGKKEIS